MSLRLTAHHKRVFYYSSLLWSPVHIITRTPLKPVHLLTHVEPTSGTCTLADCHAELTPGTCTLADSHAEPPLEPVHLLTFTRNPPLDPVHLLPLTRNPPLELVLSISMVGVRWRGSETLVSVECIRISGNEGRKRHTA